MYQAPAAIWNRIAETQPLRTDWARQMFPLPADDLARALEAEEARLAEEAGSAVVAAAYLTVMPLVWEAEAIRAFQEEHGPTGSLPMIETAQEAAVIASADFPMTADQIRTLRSMLETKPR